MNDRDIIARRELRAAGVTDEQMRQVTGFGRRRVADGDFLSQISSAREVTSCKADDTILNKYMSGALSMHGVMMVLYGADSPEHHAGRVVKAAEGES